MSTTKLFLNITARATASGIIIALTVQAVFGALLAIFGLAAALTNRGADLASPGNAIASLAGIFILWLIGAVAGGLFSIPAGIFVGATGGILLSILTRIFFYPPNNARRYRVTMGILMGAYAFIVSWLCFMAVYLLFARDNEIQSPNVPWLAMIPALIAGGLGYFISAWITRWYIQTMQRAAQPQSEIKNQKS
ncbi:MAG: hypothetical protein HDKAJFGB_00983 [Anaerolineae bacterium]|nr:hypothetical protein [Anaerolineae bacterium]